MLVGVTSRADGLESRRRCASRPSNSRSVPNTHEEGMMPPEWLVAWAPVLLALLSALAASLSAHAARKSADTAHKEFQVARRPFPFIRWDDARLTEIVTTDEHGQGQAGLIINGCIHEASGVPTTLHRVRMRLRVGPREVGHGEEPGAFQDLPVGRGALLFGKHVYYVLHDVRSDLTISRAVYEDFARRGVPIITAEAELVVSGPEQSSETWRIVAWLIHSRDDEGKGYILRVRHFPPIRDPESDSAGNSDQELLRPQSWST